VPRIDFSGVYAGSMLAYDIACAVRERYHGTVPMATNAQLPVLACDIGGSHISVALCRKDPLRVDQVRSAVYPSDITAEGFLLLLGELGASVSVDFGELAGVTLAVPNPFDIEAGISLIQHKLQFLFGLDLRLAVATRFGLPPSRVRFVHDAGAFLLGEMAIGAARNTGRAVGITLGTGIGTAFCRSGHLVARGPGIPPGGEIWNLRFEDGIVEDFVSARAIQRICERRTGHGCDVADLAAAAPEDEIARAIFAEFGRYLGKALRAFLTDFTPDLVVLGGGIAHAAELFLPNVLREIDETKMRVAVSSMLDRAALAGAASAWFNGGIADDSPAKLASTVAFSDLA